MPISWNDSLLTGILAIDAQHKSLVDSFARLSRAFKSGEAPPLMAGLANFLVSYAEEHFGTEEILMRQHAYPGFAEHLKEHEEFACEARELARKIAVEGASHEIAADATEKLADWIMNHIRKEDMKMGEYLKRQIEDNSTSFGQTPLKTSFSS